MRRETPSASQRAVQTFSPPPLKRLASSIWTSHLKKKKKKAENAQLGPLRMPRHAAHWRVPTGEAGPARVISCRCLPLLVGLSHRAGLRNGGQWDALRGAGRVNG